MSIRPSLKESLGFRSIKEVNICENIGNLGILKTEEKIKNEEKTNIDDLNNPQNQDSFRIEDLFNLFVFSLERVKT